MTVPFLSFANNLFELVAYRVVIGSMASSWSQIVGNYNGKLLVLANFGAINVQSVRLIESRIDSSELTNTWPERGR